MKCYEIWLGKYGHWSHICYILSKILDELTKKGGVVAVYHVSNFVCLEKSLVISTIALLLHYAMLYARVPIMVYLLWFARLPIMV